MRRPRTETWAALGLVVALVACGGSEAAGPAAGAPAERAPLHVTRAELAAAPGVVRLVSYNVLWNTIFPEVDERAAGKFARLARALDADVWCLQEIGVHPRDRDLEDPPGWTADDVAALMDRVQPLPAGRWHAFQASDNVTVSRWPLRLTRAETVPEAQRPQAIALVDLPDAEFAVDLYLLNNHYKCCDPLVNDPLRQQQSDAILAWLRDARTPGGEVDLPPGTPMAVVGDLNIVGSFEPVTTLLAGDVRDEARYGADGPPDWDGTALVDLHPRHNGAGAADYTWRNDEDPYDPGRLDFVLYTDSVLEPVQAFVLDTAALEASALRAAGLERYDVYADDAGRVADHLPIVVDFRVRPLAGR